MLGWEVGTFEFLSSRILAIGYNHHAKIKLRTGGSVAKIGSNQAKELAEGDGYYWDLETHGNRSALRMPVKFRYRSPIVFEFHAAGVTHLGVDAYAVIWLQTLVDNENTPFNIPIWKTKNGARLTQNFITEENLSAKEAPGLEDLEEIGRLHFRGRFKAGMDESHEQFITDNNSRETFETWEACLAEGVRTKIVDKEVPEQIQQLHDESLTEGRDVLKQAEPDEKDKWLGKDGSDWSGAFTHDPKAYVNSEGNKQREPGAEAPLHDPYAPSSDDDTDVESDEDVDLGIQDNDNMDASKRRSAHRDAQGRRDGIPGTATESNIEDGDVNRQNKRTEERKHRGLMQWKPARNLKFAKDEGKIGLKKLKAKITGGLNGREPDVETET